MNEILLNQVKKDTVKIRSLIKQTENSDQIIELSLELEIKILILHVEKHLELIRNCELNLKSKKFNYIDIVQNCTLETQKLSTLKKELIHLTKELRDVKVNGLYKDFENIFEKYSILKTSIEQQKLLIRNQKIITMTRKENILITESLLEDLRVDTITNLFTNSIGYGIYAFYGVDGHCFKLNNTIYEALVDQESKFKKIKIVDNNNVLTFSKEPIAFVTIYKNSSIDGFYLRDTKNYIQLEVGTNHEYYNGDDYDAYHDDDYHDDDDTPFIFRFYLFEKYKKEITNEHYN